MNKKWKKRLSKNCQFEKELSAFLDGELSDALAEQIKMHLSVCKTCCDALTSLQLVNEKLENLEEIELSTDFERILLEKIAKEAQKIELRPSLINFILSSWRPYAVALSVAVLIAVIVFRGNSTGLANEEILIASHMEMLQEYEILDNLEMLENMELFLPAETDS